MTELPWVAEARRHHGKRERTGANDHPLLDAGWASFGAQWLGGQPWCGLFVAHCLRSAGRLVVPFWFRARSWETTKMTKLDHPAYGCFVTFTRWGGGHVGFVVGVDARGNLMVYGGNQRNMVSVAPFNLKRVTGYYWPSASDGTRMKPAPFRYTLPVLDASSMQLSENEA